MASSRDPHQFTHCADCTEPMKFFVFLTKKVGHMTVFRAVCTACYWKEKKG